MKELDRTGSGRQAGRSKDDSGGDNKSDSWIEGKDGSYRGSRRRDSRWDESDNAKRIWHNNNEDRMAQGQRFRGGPEWGDMGSNMPEDSRDGDRREDYHIRKVKDVVECNVEDVESWDRSGNRRQDDEEKTNDRHNSSKDRDDIVEGRGRPVAKNQDEDEDYGDKSRSKDEIYWEEEERKRGWKSSKMGRGVKRSWSPLHRRGRAEQDDPDREWSDDRRDERGFRRDYDRDRDRFPDREADFQQWDRDRDFRTRETFREEGDFFRDRTREKEDPERWKHRQRDRQREKEDETDYNFERDGWEVPRREKERAERDFKSGEDRKDKDQIDLLKSPQSSGIVSDTMERGGNNNATIDLVRERGFGSGSPYLSRRGDSGPPSEFFGNNGDADWMGDERHRHLEGDYLDRNFFDEDNPLGPDQNFGRSSSRGSDGLTPLNAHSGRGRGPKGSPGQRGRGGGDGRPPFANNQGTGMMMRGLQQSGKGGRGRGGKAGRSSARDTQRGGGIPPPLMGPGPGPVPVPGPGMVPHFGGHMGPPGSIPVLGSNMGPGPAPGLGPGGFPLPPFVGPVGWAGGRGAADMGMHPGPAGPAPPVHAPSPATPRFGPNMGPGPGHGVFFSPPRGASNVMPAPSYGSAPFGGRGLLPEKAPMSRMPPRVNAPAGLAPSRGEQNDYSQHFVDTGLRPQNFIRDVDLGDRFEEYPKLKELITRKDKLITDHACPPMYLQGDLRALELSPELFGTKFDVILVDPPWEEYVRRAPGVGDSMEWWSFEEIQNLRIEAIADTPSFIFLWVGDAEGLDQGRLCLKKWGFRRCEDICWVKTNKENPTPALRHDASTVLQHSKEHCLMGIRGTVRRSSDAHIIHANIDTDIIISEEPAYGSTAKPEELYHIVEHFALGQRRLELFGEDHNIRNGWITVGKNLTSSNFNAQTYCKYVGDAEGKVWQGGRGNPPLDAPHLVGTTPEIEALRPKSPPPRAQQQPQSQAANSASQPSAAHSNSKKAANASQGMSPQNAQGSGQVANSSSVIVLAASSPSQGQRGGSSKQMRRSPLHLEAGQGITGSEDERAMGHDSALDPAASANEEVRQSKDTASQGGLGAV